MSTTLSAMRMANVRTAPRRKINKVVFSARISEAEFNGLDELAARDQITMTEIFRQWLRTLPTYHPAPLRPPHRGKERG